MRQIFFKKREKRLYLKKHIIDKAAGDGQKGGHVYWAEASAPDEMLRVFLYFRTGLPQKCLAKIHIHKIEAVI